MQYDLEVRRLADWVLYAVLTSSAACAGHHTKLAQPAAPLTPPLRLCATGEAQSTCRSANAVESLLTGDSTLLGMADPPSGSQGAKILTLRSSWGVVLRAKWRPQSSGDLINEPRKELASYAVQKLFLDGNELVAPPTVARCIPREQYRQFAPDEPATFPDSDCVFGYSSYWLEGVRTVDAARKDHLLGAGEGILDAGRFHKDEVYRTSLAKANLLTYLINHGDAHNEQFLLQAVGTGHSLRAFVVDNSIAFLSIPNPMLLFREDWAKIQVPWLPKHSIERLRKLGDADFARLGTIAELERQGAQLKTIRDTSVASDGTAMSWQGARLRIGLTTNEIALVRDRVRELLERPDLEQLTRADP